jgi:hypothetical protein
MSKAIEILKIHAIEILKILGSAAAIACFFILMGLVVTVYILTTTDDAELFPSPIVYLDAQKNFRNNLFYEPINGETFCLGDDVLWEKNAGFIRSTRIQRSYYLQVERPYKFGGPQAEELTEKYGTDVLTTRPLYSSILPSTHVSEGFFDGGIQVFTLPTADELRPHEGIKPGDHLRIYVDVEAPFSQANGYYVPLQIGEDCPVVEPTARQGVGGFGPQWAQR